MNNKSKKRLSKWMIWGVITAIISAASLIIMTRGKTPSGDEVLAKTGDIMTYYSFSGRVEAKNRSMVYAEQAIQVSEFKVKEGGKVKKDDVLYLTKTGIQVKAASAGEVLKIYAQENEQIMPGGKILEIVDYSELQLKVQVDENDLSAIQKDVKATVTINALSKDIEGTIKEISKEGTYLNGATFFEAMITIPKDDDIKVGMSAEVKVIKSKVTGVVVLPMSAIQFNDNNEAYVYIEEDKGKLDDIKLTLGLTDGAYVEIKYGLTASDKVFVPKEKKEALNPGSRMQAMPGGEV